MTMALRTRGAVHAFEPLPEPLLLLKRHVEVNGLDNIVVHGVALSNQVGFVEFSSTGSSMGNTYIQESKLFLSSPARVLVRVTTVDELVFGEARLPPPRFLKIDVEGAEHDVLQGAARTIDAYHPVILLATHDFHLPGVKDQCLAWMREHGYACQLTDRDKGLADREDFFCRPRPGEAEQPQTGRSLTRIRQ
jgi:FkbM family methyltransferase